MRSRFLHAFAIAASLAVVVSGSGGCDTSVVQCLSEAECHSKGPGFENTTCDAVTKTCVPVTSLVGTCKTNAECIAANANQPAICRKSDRKCVNLQTAECPDFIGGAGTSRISDDNAIVIGYLGLQNAVPFGVEHLRSAKLAQEDFTTSVKGLPSFDGSGAPRPVVILACNEILVGDDGLLTAANHLMKEVQVPIVIGPIDGADITRVRPIADATKTMLLLTSSAGGGPKVPAPLYWGMGGANADFLAGYTIGLDPVIKRLEARGFKQPSEPLRVLMVQENTAEGALVAKYILEHAVFDGVKAVDHDSSTFQIADMGNPIFDPVTTPAPFSYVASHVLPIAYKMKPHIVLHAGGSGAFPIFVIDPIESGWDVATGGAQRPVYYGYSQGIPATLPLVLGGNPTLLGRVYVTDTIQVGGPPDPVRLTTFLARYNQENTDSPLTPGLATQLILNAYDGVYLAEFALTAIGNAPLTGTNAANAMVKMASGGEDVPDDPDTITHSLSTLANGGTLTLNGLGGRFAFNPQTGSCPSATELFCLQYDKATGNVFDVKTGITYDSQTAKQSGTYDTTACP